MAYRGSTGLSGQDLGRENKRDWVDVQHRTFTHWVNMHLGARSLHVDNLEEGFKTGANLCELVEEISAKKMGRYAKAPKSRFEMLQNASTAIKFIESQGIQLTNIGPEDMVDPKVKLILGLVWTLILRYQISKSRGGKNDLLEWVKRQVAPYNITVVNFTTSFADGIVLCALADSLRPGLINVAALDPKNRLHNAQLGISKATDDLHVPKLMMPEDFAEFDTPDEHSVMTYVSYFKEAGDKLGVKPQPIPSAASTTASAEMSAYGEGLSKAVANVRTHFTISYSTQKIILKELTVKISGSGNIKISSENIEFSENNDRTVTVYYIAVLPGKYMIDVIYQSKKITGSPFHLTVSEESAGTGKAATILASEWTAEGEGLRTARVNEVSRFTITRRGNATTSVSITNMVVILRRTGASRSEEEVHGKVVEQSAGVLLVTYTLKSAGSYSMFVTWAGDAITGSPFSLTCSGGQSSGAAATSGGATDPTKCVIQVDAGGKGKEVKVGEGVLINLFTYDSQGQKRTVGGDKIIPTATLVTKGKGTETEVLVDDRGDGSYWLVFIPPQAGSWAVTIALGKTSTQVQGSPLTINVLPAAETEAKSTAAKGESADVVAQNCIAEGEGIDEAFTAQKNTFMIRARDSAGKDVSSGGEKWDVEVTSSSGDNVSANISDLKNGKYEVTFTPTNPGMHKISVSRKGESIEDSPFYVPVSSLIESSLTIFENPATANATWRVGKPVTLTFRAASQKGKITSGGDSLAWRAEITYKGERIVSKIIDEGNGTYTITFVPEHEGEYSVDVNVADKVLKGSPFTVKVGASGAGTETAGPVANKGVSSKGAEDDDSEDEIDLRSIAGGLKGSAGSILSEVASKKADQYEGEQVVADVEATPGAPVQLVVQLNDDEGNPLEGGVSRFTVSVDGPQSPKAIVLDLGDGAYAVQVTPKAVGVYRVYVNFDGNPVRADPFIVKVTTTGGSHSTGTGDPEFDIVSVPSQSVELVIQLNDSEGSGLTGGKGRFDVNISGPQKVSSVVEDRGAGTYAILFTPTAEGIYTANIKFDGNEVRSKPFAIKIAKGVAAFSRSATDTSDHDSKAPSSSSSGTAQSDS